MKAASLLVTNSKLSSFWLFFNQIHSSIQILNHWIPFWGHTVTGAYPLLLGKGKGAPWTVCLRNGSTLIIQKYCKDLSFPYCSSFLGNTFVSWYLAKNVGCRRKESAFNPSSLTHQCRAQPPVIHGTQKERFPLYFHSLWSCCFSPTHRRPPLWHKGHSCCQKHRTDIQTKFPKPPSKRHRRYEIFLISRCVFLISWNLCLKGWRSKTYYQFQITFDRSLILEFQESPEVCRAILTVTSWI